MLSRYSMLKTRDFEYSRHIHSLQRLDLEPVNCKTLGKRVKSVANGFESADFQLFSFTHSADMTLDAVADNPHFWLGFPVFSRRDKDHRLSIRPVGGASRLASPGRADPLRLAANRPSLGLCLKHQTLQPFAEKYFGDDGLKPLVFRPEFDMSNSANRMIANLIAMLVEEEDIDPTALLDARHVHSFVDAVASTLLLYCPHSHSALLQRPVPGPSPRDVKRVIDYIRARSDTPITLSELVAVADVPGRTLNEHFRAFTGCSPMAYLKRMRLKNANRLMQSGRVHKVADAANQSGLYHFGRFSHAYLREFGELPSETLARRRRQE